MITFHHRAQAVTYLTRMNNGQACSATTISTINRLHIRTLSQHPKLDPLWIISLSRLTLSSNDKLSTVYHLHISSHSHDPSASNRTPASIGHHPSKDQVQQAEDLKCGRSTRVKLDSLHTWIISPSALPLCHHDLLQLKGVACNQSLRRCRVHYHSTRPRSIQPIMTSAKQGKCFPRFERRSIHNSLRTIRSGTCTMTTASATFKFNRLVQSLHLRRAKRRSKLRCQISIAQHRNKRQIYTNANRLLIVIWETYQSPLRHQCLLSHHSLRGRQCSLQKM